MHSGHGSHSDVWLLWGLALLASLCAILLISRGYACACGACRSNADEAAAARFPRVRERDYWRLRCSSCLPPYSSWLSRLLSHYFNHLVSPTASPPPSSLRRTCSSCRVRRWPHLLRSLCLRVAASPRPSPRRLRRRLRPRPVVALPRPPSRLSARAPSRSRLAPTVSAQMPSLYGIA